jgi:molecular chaperone GrpE
MNGSGNRPEDQQEVAEPAGSANPRDAAATGAGGEGAGDQAEPVHGAALAADATTGGAPTGATGAAAGEHASDDPLAAMTAERDGYLSHLQRVQAEFENYRKRVARQQSDAADQASARLADALLPVLDACDAAVRHGAAEVEPIYAALLGALEKEGMARIDPEGDAFDPSLHEAVMHEPGDGEADGPIVADVLRPGYSWKGRVLRPAMVKVKG